MPATVDLNADLGETPGDLDLIGVVTSANIACGGHAGDLATMRDACERAVAAGVAIGAHPGYADRPAMGRTELGLPAPAVVALVGEQVAALAECAEAAGGRLAYVKLHGALYHRAGHDIELADALAAELAGMGKPAVLAQPGAALVAAARGHGLQAVTEGYCDRGYRADGSLVPRGEHGALVTDPDEAAEQALGIATRGGVRATDGSFVAVAVDSLCLHGDTPAALASAGRIHERLQAAGVRVASSRPEGMRRDEPMGDGAVLVRAGGTRAARLLAALVEQAAWPGVEDVVAGADSVLVVVDPDVADASTLGEPLSALADEAVTAAHRKAEENRQRAHHDIPVVFDGEDRDAVAAAAGVEADALVERICETVLEVAFVGFLPGFAYLDGLSPALAAVPRRETPRARVPAGSVALAGGYAGIYPLATPGGWQLVGRTDHPLLDVATPPFARLAPGDAVRFRHVEEVGPPPVPRRAVHSAVGRRAVVLDPGPLSTVQDAGRAGVASAGIPRAGPADPWSHGVANLAAGNEAGDAAVEVTLGGLRLRFEAGTAVALAGDAPLSIDGRELPTHSVQPVAAGQVVSVGAPRAGVRAYLAVAGGLRTRQVFGSRATDTVSGIGPALLQAGDELALGEPGRPRGLLRRPPFPPATAVLRVIPGPDRPDAAATLTDQEWVVAPESDRAGIRLLATGRATPGVAGVPSHGVVTGAVQLPPGGGPVVLGVDHGTLGGYAVVATVITADLPFLGQFRPGASVRFEVVGMDDARRARNAAAQSAAASLSGWYPDHHL